MASKYTQKYLILKFTFPILYAQTLDAKGKMHATGPLKLSKRKIDGFIYFLKFLRPTITMNDKSCFEVLILKYLGWVFIQTGYLIALGS